MKKLSTYLSNKTVVLVDYEDIDTKAGAGDAQYLSICNATWNNYYGSRDFSAKVYRVTDNNDWSRQSEELPFWRVLDLAILLASEITGKECSLQPYLNEEISQEKRNELKQFIDSQDGHLKKRLKELKRIIEDI